MSKPTVIGRGYFWQDLAPQQEFLTFGRTLTETDLMNFITVTGMTELIFTDVHHKGAIEGRVVPAALTYTLIEGLLVQGMIQGTGMALLEIKKKILAPVRVGDTVHGHVRITDIRPTSKHGRAVVTSEVAVINQDGTTVMRYLAKRLLAGDPDRVTPVPN
ncbi:MaoC family dehydratase [Acidovorax carolinensis]|uniref:MaoC family dehydratase n=1 Tax=Acidovorax carolinensis TaxID=553814 RepID=UPI000B344F8E|nr:MaoC/PaaZ C-terminal domain-containing protein [Acidovorax carolinensis]ART49565.1 acyl dehydratase [Acidovorax carolinensis]